MAPSPKAFTAATCHFSLPETHGYLKCCNLASASDVSYMPCLVAIGSASVQVGVVKKWRLGRSNQPEQSLSQTLISVDVVICLAGGLKEKSTDSGKSKLPVLC